MDDNVELTYKKKKKQRRIRCIGVIVAIIAAFLIGFLIGYFAVKSKSKDHKDEDKKHDTDKKLDFRKQREETMKHHKNFQTIISEEQLNISLK